MGAAAEDDNDTPHAYALRYAGLGLRVLPIKPGYKRPPMASWQHAATNNTSTINAWYAGLYRDAGVGIALGPQPNGTYLFAVDVDVHDPDADGRETLHDLEQHYGALPDTWTAITGADGAHRIFAAPAGITIRNQQAAGQRLGAGIDIRGDGGQIVAAPTVHPETGRRYHWEIGFAPWEHPIATAPTWLLQLVKDPPPAPPPTPGPTSSGPSIADQLRATWDWHHELAARGWTHDRTAGNGDSYWVRPGKDPRAGHSAVLHPGGPFVIFTTAMPAAWTAVGHRTADGSGYSMSPFDFVAANDHQGDRSAAARALGGTSTTHHAGDDEQPITGDDPDRHLLDMLTDWPDFWANGHGEAEWLAEPIIPAHRSVALFAPGGTGKSLLALWLSAHLATGTDPFNNIPSEPISVLYLDYEMTADDLAERLEQMGFGAHSDLGHLHYALLPGLPGLDEPEGGKAVKRLAALVAADLVVIDTFGRAVHGDENEADTVRAWYRNTGLHLKQDGRAFLRVDHAGKDLAKGQRGTSAKNDDVDVVWQMTAKESGAFTLTAKKRRMGWIPERVQIQLDEHDVLRFGLIGGDTWPAGTAETAAVLDELAIPVDASQRIARDALKEAGHRASSEVLRAAHRYRRQRSTTFHFVGDEAVTQREKQIVAPANTAPEQSRRGADADRAGDQSGAVRRDPPKDLLDDVRRGVRRGAARSSSPVRRGAPIVDRRNAAGAPETPPAPPPDDYDASLFD